MRINKFLLSVLLLCMAQVLTLPMVRAADNLTLHGALVEEPCSILPGDETITLDFGSVVDKDLYQNQRTVGKAFHIRLADCDISLGKSVKVIFSGNESAALPGLLSLQGAGATQGAAIGFETSDGQPLPLNTSSQENILEAGNNIITIKAYVRGEPDAIATKTIKPGAFSAVATFTFTYE